MSDKWKCEHCHRITVLAELLRAPNPFGGDDEILGCPGCKETGNFQEICDEPDCVAGASCGWPSPTGYRRTCYDHGKHAFKSEPVRRKL